GCSANFWCSISARSAWLWQAGVTAASGGGCAEAGQVRPSMPTSTGARCDRRCIERAPSSPGGRAFRDATARFCWKNGYDGANVPAKRARRPHASGSIDAPALGSGRAEPADARQLEREIERIDAEGQAQQIDLQA